MIQGITGPEGGGKTLLMAYFGLLHKAYGGRLLTFPGFEVTDGKGKVISEQLDIDQWITMPPELRDALICIDEVQNFFNSRRHMSVMNYLFANLAAQRRHRNIGIMYTVQDWGWLDDRLRWLTHVLITCKDLYWSPWGKEQGLKRGELISASFWDVKGFFTGTPWTPGPQRLLQAKNIWPHYNSWADVDIWSGLTKVELKRPRTVIDLTSQEGEEEPSAPAPPGAAGAPAAAGVDNDLEKLARTPGINMTSLRRVAQKLKGAG